VRARARVELLANSCL